MKTWIWIIIIGVAAVGGYFLGKKLGIWKSNSEAASGGRGMAGYKTSSFVGPKSVDINL